MTNNIINRLSASQRFRAIEKIKWHIKNHPNRHSFDDNTSIAYISVILDQMLKAYNDDGPTFERHYDVTYDEDRIEIILKDNASDFRIPFHYDEIQFLKLIFSDAK